MSDPVLTFVLIASFIIAVGAAHYFKTLDGAFARSAGSSAGAGIVCGIVFAAIDLPPIWEPLAVGALLTAAALYVRHVGRESEPVDGMLFGALAGAIASIPAAVWHADGPALFSEAILAGAVAGWGIVFASFHVTDSLRRFAIDVATGIAAIGAAAAPRFLASGGIPVRSTAIFAAALVPLIAIASVFVRASEIRRELNEEAALGFIDDRDVRRTAHPFLRFRHAGWADAAAWREFVRIANRIALRKRQQRNRPEEIARLYQLEIIKLRMHLQEMARIGRPPEAATGEAGDDVPSDRMHA